MAVTGKHKEMVSHPIFTHHQAGHYRVNEGPGDHFRIRAIDQECITIPAQDTKRQHNVSKYEDIFYWIHFCQGLLTSTGAALQ